MSVDAVVFDIGWIFIEWRPEAVFDELIGEDRRRALFDAVPMLEVNDAIDLGAPFRQSFAELAAKHPEYAREIMLWPEHWHQMVTPRIDRSVRLLHALKAKRVPVFALSNFGDETFDIAQKMYPFFADFDRRYVSGRLKVMKPDPAIYEIVEKDSGVAPARLLFTDDKPENIDAAAARGWQVHLFKGPDGFAERLISEGLLTEEEAQ
ncbi:HAD family hydrolase [Primorskyibacter sp. S187A]|uniref:HAD family hydrolase n=1 Tax=Primorskyibacter sp. S187A TaxID=3415130 RepID=UPI003C7AD6EC